MSKFEEYLEAVKSNIYNELFNIDTSKIKMKKIIEKYNYNFTYIFLSLFPKNKIEQVFSLNEDDLKKIVYKKMDGIFGSNKELTKEAADDFVVIFYKLKNENCYIIENDEYTFIVGKKLYKLKKLSEDINKIIYITFFEEPGGFKANSIMSSKDGGSKLFNKIRGIIESEIPDWKTKIFGFEPKLEQKEEKKDNIAWDIFFTIRYLTEYFVENDTAMIPIKLKYLKSDLKKISSIAVNKIKEKIFLNIESSEINDEFKKEISSFINAIFNGTKLPEASPALIKFSSTNKWKNSSKAYNLIIGWSEYDLGIIHHLSARTRIYIIIIKQMFGKKVKTKPVGKNLLFSMLPIPENIKIV